jgi:uncharacterized LabA/DUF88 family protein
MTTSLHAPRTPGPSLEKNMASPHDNLSMALFCDFENVALGVRDANYDKFDIKPVLERLLLKGSIVVKKAYCDWDRYKGFKAAMHEANFELIEIPHVRQSGKNSADIRLVVDALDLCYTKSHVNTFVIISGDSDFSPLVSKLRENAKQVIGVGVKQSTSDLLIANCDEFIFYDDLVREIQRSAARREARETPHAPKRPPEEDKRRKEELEARKTKAIELAVETFDALVAERGDSGKIWASMLKEALKRRKPDFSESYYGFRAFGNLLEEAQARGLLEFGRDEKSGAYVYRSSSSRPAASEAVSEQGAPALGSVEAGAEPSAGEEAGGKHETRRRGRGGRKSAGRTAEPVAVAASGEAHAPAAPVAEAATTIGAEAGAPAAATEEAATHEPRRRGRGGRKPAATAVEALAPASNAPASNAPASNAGEPLAPTAAPAALLVSAQHSAETAAPVAAGVASEPAAGEEATARHEPRRRGRGGRKAAAHKAEALAAEMSAGAPQAQEAPGVASERPAPGAMVERSAPRTRRSRGAADFSTPEPAPAQAPAADDASTHAAAEESSAKPAAPRSRRPRKAATAPENG